MESKEYKVSIIVPVYNAEQYLDRCVQSLIKQTHTNLELLLLDDGSKDQSLSICQGYAEKDNRIVVIHNENHGVSYTRNYGLDRATGDYITFVDSDDWVESNYVEKLLTDAINHHVDVSMCGYCLDLADGTTKNWKSFQEQMLSLEEVLDPFSMYFQGGVCSKLYSRNLLNCSDPVRFANGIKIGEDRLFWFASVLRAKTIYLSSDPLYHYCMNDSGATKSKRFEERYTDFLARQQIVQMLSDYPKLKVINALSCANVAAKTIASADYSEDDQRVRSLIVYLKAHLFVFLRNHNFSAKERLQALLVSSGAGRYLLKLKHIRSR